MNPLAASESFFRAQQLLGRVALEGLVLNEGSRLDLCAPRSAPSCDALGAPRNISGTRPRRDATFLERAAKGLNVMSGFGADVEAFGGFFDRVMLRV